MIQLEYDILDEIMNTGEKTYINKPKFEGYVSYFKDLSEATNMTLFLGVSSNDEYSIFTYGGYRIAGFNRKKFGNSLDLETFYNSVAKTLVKEPEYIKNMPIALFTEPFCDKLKEYFYIDQKATLQKYNFPKKVLEKKVKANMKPIIAEIDKNRKQSYNSLKRRNKSKNL